MFIIYILSRAPLLKLAYSEFVDLCMCVSVYILTDCLSRRVSPHWCVFVCVSPVSLSPLHRWANGADHRGNHGGAPSITTGDERPHRHLWTAGPIREPGACLCTVGGGEMHCE